MYRLTAGLMFISCLLIAKTDEETDRQKINRSVLDYIESQHSPSADRMARGIDKKLAKRTYWQNKNGEEFVLETDYETMLWVAENYNKDGNQFPEEPRIDINILDIDNRVASVKLTVDDWVDYMHLYKDENAQWKIINVLWQYHDRSKHKTPSGG